MISTGSKTTDEAVARFLEAAKRHDSGDLPLVADALNHYSGHMEQYQRFLQEEMYLDILGRKWVRDNPGKARAELAKVEAEDANKA